MAEVDFNRSFALQQSSFICTADNDYHREEKTHIDFKENQTGIRCDDHALNLTLQVSDVNPKTAASGRVHPNLIYMTRFYNSEDAKYCTDQVTKPQFNPDFTLHPLSEYIGLRAARGREI